MARWVLLKVSDESGANLALNGGDKVIGVWDIPKEFCSCEKRDDKANWTRDPEQQRPVCKTCGKVHRIYLDITPRVRWAFGRNILKKLRGVED